MSWLKECQKAYYDVPSQDNEGYVPDRGAFKCGFRSAWHLQQQKIYKLNEELAQALRAINETWDFIHQLQDQGGRLPGEFDTLVDTLRKLGGANSALPTQEKE